MLRGSRRPARGPKSKWPVLHEHRRKNDEVLKMPHFNEGNTVDELHDTFDNHENTQVFILFIEHLMIQDTIPIQLSLHTTHVGIYFIKWHTMSDYVAYHVAVTCCHVCDARPASSGSHLTTNLKLRSMAFLSADSNFH